MTAPGRGGSGSGGAGRKGRQTGTAGTGRQPFTGGRSWRLFRAYRDAVPPSVRRFMARARQRRLRAALPWAVGVGVLAVVGLLIWTVYATAVFGVREVRVVGAAVASVEQVRAAAAIGARSPLARVDLDRVRARVEGLAPVDHAVVTRDWPDAVVVQVVERTPVAAVPRGDAFLLMDGEGVAFTTAARPPAGLPVVRLANPAPGDINTRAALTVLSALTDDLREQLTELSVQAPARIRLALKKDRDVVWGDDTQSPTKARVATALLQRKGKTIDVSAPDVVTLR
jgi:cell division protein FtsQ